MLTAIKFYTFLSILTIVGLISYIVYKFKYLKDTKWKVENVNTIRDVGGRTAFGEISTASPTPVFQLDGLYGTGDTDDFKKNSALSGSQSVDNAGLMTVSSGTDSKAFATLRSKRSVRYRPGQGSMARFTAMFPNGHVTNYQQVAGYINQTDIIGVGFNYLDSNKEFSVIRRYNSQAEIYKVTVTTGASGNETFRITLNGENFDISCTSGNTAHNAAELAAATYTGWIIDVVDSTVYFLYDGPPGNLTGTFSVSNTTGGGTMAANGTTLQNGVTPIDLWTPQSSWNIDRLDGKGGSGMLLNPKKLNVFQIDFRWLGVGLIRYSIEDENTGQMIAFHYEHFTNKNIITHISNPSMRIGYGVVNIAGGGTNVVVKGGSIMGAIQGTINYNNITHSVTHSESNLAQNDTHHLLTLKVNRINESGTIGNLNQREVILENIALGVLANAGNIATIKIYKGAELVDDEDAGSPNDVQFLYTTVYEDGVASSTTTGHYKADTGKLVATFVVTSNSTDNIDLEKYRIILTPLERISIFVSCPAQVSPTVAITFREE